MRKLASIQKIGKIEPIEGADRIELAHVLGWQCVVNKGQLKEGDLAVYFEIDSFLPIRDEFEFLRKSSYKKNDLMGEGFRMKTMKFRGQISQGLLLPLDTFTEIPSDVEEGTDVTELLGVKKWEIPERVTTGGTIMGQLPYSISHTDETRIQAEPSLLNEFKGLEYYITTKMDGSSHSVSIDADGFHVTGHNYEYKDDGKSSFYNLVKELGLETKMREYMSSKGIQTLTIQGELCAPGIQKNRLKLLKPEWYVFTVNIDGKRGTLNDIKETCSSLNLKMVPLEEVGRDLPTVYPDVDSLLARSVGEYPNGGQKEGIVIRPVEFVYSEIIGGPLSIKVVNNKNLLKNDE